MAGPAARAQIKEVLQKYLGADDDLYDLNLTAKCASCMRRRLLLPWCLTVHACWHFHEPAVLVVSGHGIVTR